MEVSGTCKEGFEAVRDAFEQNFAEGLEVGAAAAVTVDGESVVDIWAGDADPQSASWDRDTIVNVYSTTKTMAATCMLALADRGQLDFDAPVCEYWPEFAQNGKDGVLVCHVMSHTAGLPGFVPAVSAEDLYDLDVIAERLAAQELWFEPGTKSAYHAVTQGNLEGEILYRITGRRMADWFREEIAEPLGADFWMSLPASEDRRVSDLIPPPPPPMPELNGVPVGPDSTCIRTMTSCLLNATEPRTRAWRAAEIPAAGGFGNARSIARIHSMLACGGDVDGVRIMSYAGARKALEEQIDNIDDVLLLRLRHGLGFARELDGWVTSPNPNHMFWGGWGGSIAVVDFDVRASVAYVMNRMDAAITGDPRGGRIVDAAFASISAAG
ncbi:serine hydrolase domain-containing protein [Candidatus Poriferisodalis sp.]|uniref:serine hydrolase domain-containing protein n=1 Tax=Candidatus Poriferisodalis sp. TaxID=3101277 RepID=UPI003B52995F